MKSIYKCHQQHKQQQINAEQQHAAYLNNMKQSSQRPDKPVTSLQICTKAQKERCDKANCNNGYNNHCHKCNESNQHTCPKTVIDITSFTVRLVSVNLSGFGQNHSKSRLSRRHQWLPTGMILLQIILQLTLGSTADIVATTPMQSNIDSTMNQTTKSLIAEHIQSSLGSNDTRPLKNSSWQNDSIILRLAKRFSTGNELWDGIIHDCYRKPTFSCLQKNVYAYLNDAFSARDVNVTQRLKFYKNNIDFDLTANESILSKEGEEDADNNIIDSKEQIPKHKIPGMAARNLPAETPIEEVTNALYDKSLKFAMTHDVEIQMPEVLFDGATFRIAPRSFEGNGIIAKLELIPKQVSEARLAGKIIMKKIQKFLKSKLLLSFIALLLVIKIIKIKIFWLLPLIIGVGAAKKLLLKFLLFIFPALSHLFKLCSYYQQTYHHSTKFHHHHHLINHHHTIVPAWHHAESSSIPEIIYSHPPKGHASAYLHGAPIHETYGPAPAYEHFEGGWENSGPGLGSEYLNDINRIAQIDENTNKFKPHAHDANVISNWGLGTTQTVKNYKSTSQSLASTQQQQQQQLPSNVITQQQRPPLALQKQQEQQLLFLQKQQQQQQQRLKQHIQQQQQQQPQLYQKPLATSHSFNPFTDTDKQSIINSKYKLQTAQSAPSPVYYPSRNGIENTPAAQASPTADAANQLTPELAAQLKEALRRKAEQNIIAHQQKILERQPFVQNGEPLATKSYDPFYSPIIMKVDKIIQQLGVKDDLCKERVICSMYRDPARYTPHSNFVSAELSRDTNELQPVSDPEHPAVMRFYRYVQAARDGQEQKNCLELYAQCNINTE